MSAPSDTTSPLIRAHRCIGVTCSRCNEPFVDEETDTPVCFESISQAVRRLAEWDWEVNDEQVICPACTDTPTSVTAVSICEYCSPPLFSDRALPDRCCCAQDPVVHIFVPLVSMAHCAIAVRTCFEVTCTDCRESFDIAGGAAHYNTERAALAAASTAEWMIAENLNLALCPTCVNQRACASLGHSWPKEAHAVVDGIELRHCERDCGHMLHRNINDSEAP